VHYKLYHSMGCAYPPRIRVDVDAMGGHLAAVDAAEEAAPTAGEGSVEAAAPAGSMALDDGEEVGEKQAAAAKVAAAAAAQSRVASLKHKMRAIAAADAASAASSAQHSAAPAGAAGAAASKSAARAGVAASGSDAAAAGAAVVGAKRSRSTVAASAADAAAAGSSSAKSAHGRSGAAATATAAAFSTFASLYDFVDAEEGGVAAAPGGAGSSGATSGAGAEAADAAALRDMAAFADSDEARAVIERAQAQSRFSRLFGGLVFFLNREVPREVGEFIICAFRGRVGWDGPGSPYAATDARITHHVVDRPMQAAGATAEEGEVDPCRTLVPGRSYIQPQWLADSVNARMLLPVSKYAPGAVLPVSARKAALLLRVLAFRVCFLLGVAWNVACRAVHEMIPLQPTSITLTIHD
jgi:hypothetical protein